jgi:HEAT repeat protein
MKKSGKNKVEKKEKKKNAYEEDEDEKTKNLNKQLLILEDEDSNFEEIMSLLDSPESKVRSIALERLRESKIEDELTFWNKIFELVEDAAAEVRLQVLLAISEGGDESMEPRLTNALEKFNRDKDSDIKRKAHKIIASYSRTGKLNVL